MMVAAMPAPAPARRRREAGGVAGGRQGGAPPIDVPWNDAIPAGTADHAARALKESPRHGEWVDIKLADGSGAELLGRLPGARRRRPASCS